MQYNFSKYLNLGFSVVPVHYIKDDGLCSCGIKECDAAGKHASVSWSQYQKKKMSSWIAKSYDDKLYNIGLICGEISGVVVLDIDGDYPEDWPDLPNTWKVKTAKGYHYYFKYDEDFRNTAKIEGHKIDFRANGGYAVAPPSVHETGVIYQWIVSPDDLPEPARLPDWLREKLKKKYRAQQIPQIAPPADQDEPYIQAAIDGEINALRSTGEGGRNNQLNESAIKLAGLISKSEVEKILTPIAFEIGLNPKEIKATINSACNAAIPREIPESKKRYIPDNIKNMTAPSESRSKEPKPEMPIHFIDSAPPLVKNMVKWILQTSMYPQPTMALAATIPCIGNVMAHRVQSYTRLRTNFYCLSIAPSGSGKDHAHDCINVILSNTGLADTFLGNPASATGAIKAVERKKGHAFMPIDEFGRFFGGTKGHNSASFSKQIPTMFLHLYNCANKLYIGQEYADNEAAGGRSDIDQPCLNIYATSVPSNFYDSLTTGETFDGFLSRWLVFETDRFDIDPQDDHELLGMPPQDIMDAINFWREQPTFVDGPGGDIAKHTMICPRIIPFDDNGMAYKKYRRDCRVKTRDSKEDFERAIWNRAAEHAMKLSLLGTDADFVVRNESFEWASELSSWLAVNLIYSVREGVSDNQYEKDLQRVKKIIKENEPISRSNLTRATQFLDKRRRSDIMDTLTESGDIFMETKDRGDGRGHVTLYFT